MAFDPQGPTTAIGSMPHTVATAEEEGLEFIGKTDDPAPAISPLL